MAAEHVNLALCATVKHEEFSERPRLTIVVPVFRVEAYLSKCLDSLLAYKGEDLEVVAVDDGSPDGCGAILDNYAAIDSRLNAVHLATNVGLGQARNAGIDHATGDYIWFVDADDWLPDGTVDLIIARLAQFRPDVLVMDHAEVLPNGVVVARPRNDILRTVTKPIRLDERPELLRLAQSACTKIARRAFLQRAGLRFFPGWYEDSSFSHPLLMMAESIDVIDHVGYFYRQQTPGGITTSTSPRHFEVFEQYDRLFGFVDDAGGAYDIYRPELFNLMLNHYLVIAGHPGRLPAGMREAFFTRIVEHYTRRLPPGGYAVPGGVIGLKHRLVRSNTYAAYAALRSAYWATGRKVTAIARRRKIRQAVTRVPIVTPKPAVNTGEPLAVTLPTQSTNHDSALDPRSAR